MPPSISLPGWAMSIGAVALGLGLLYAALIAVLFAGQRHILFRPDAGPLEVERVGQPGVVTIRLATADGLALLAWFLPAASDAPIMLYLHGNAGHLGHRAERIRRFGARGWGVLAVEYRGYGGNPGAPSELGLRLDAEAGLAALRGRGIGDARIVVWGESLGSGLATWLGARHGVGAVVLETPFTSIADIAKRRYPFAPVDLLLRDRFDSLAEVPALRAPVLVLVGGQDQVVPPEMGRAVHAAAPAPAELWEAAEAGHTDLLEFGAIEAVAAFLRRHLAQAR